MIQLSTVVLPEGLTWTDQYGWQSVTQSVRRRLDGGLAVYPQALAAGRPITLEAPSDQPLTVAQAQALTALANVAGAIYDLTLRDAVFRVMFRHEDPPAIELRLLIDYADPIDDDPVIGQIRLVSV